MCLCLDLPIDPTVLPAQFPLKDYLQNHNSGLVSRVHCHHLLALCCRDVFCAGRVVEQDLVRTMKACGGAIQTSVNGLSDSVLGMCELFEEEQIGGER